MTDVDTEPEGTAEGVPEHLRHWPGLYVREGDRIVEAPPDDAAVARAYPRWPDKGPITNGVRLTLMTKQPTYRVGEEVRVIHVVEATEPGRELYIMGPKPIYGEYVDGHLTAQLPPPNQDPLIPVIYDGPTLPGPAVDYNYDITSYRFDAPGRHEIVWRLDGLRSNVLRLDVVAPHQPQGGGS